MVLIGLTACHEASKKEPPPPAPPASGVRVDATLLTSGRVQIAPVERRAPKDAWLLPGEVVAGELGAADATTLVAGRVASILVMDGAPVKKGDVLAWVDSPEAVRATADLLRARGRSVQAAHLLARQEELGKESATSQNALDDARTADAVARADLLAATTLLRSYGGAESASGTSARIAVRAPIDGTVAERFTALGSPVTPERPLFHLIAKSEVYVLAKLPETAAMLPKNGDAVSLFLRESAGSERTGCPGHVARVFDVVDEQHQRHVRIAPDAGCTGLGVGRYVDAGFASGTVQPGLVVPRDAVVEIKGADTVFVRAADGSFAARAVRIGVRTESERVIDEGVREGEQVVVQGVVLLKGEVLKAELGQ
jgi:cobalt-zinc-cadmium efflux system membrane fusion protein